MILITIYSPTILSKTSLIIATLFLIIMLQSKIKPCLTKQLNKFEFNVYLFVMLILTIKIISNEFEEKLFFNILISIIKIYCLIRMGSRFLIFKMNTISFFQNSTIYKLNEKLKSFIYEELSFINLLLKKR